MSWLLPSLIATLTSTSLLLTVYLTLWLRYRRPHLAWWSGCWATYVGVILLAMVQAQDATDASQPFLAAVQQTLALVSAWLLFAGVHLFVERRPHPAWAVAGLLIGAWTLFGQTLGASVSWFFIPVFLLIGLMQVTGGIIILGRRRADRRLPGLSSGLAGWFMILWGLHRADYLFLKDVEWFAPFAFLISATFTTLVALALLVLFFEELSQEMAQAKDALQESKQTLDSILAAAPVGIGLMKNRRVMWANQTAYRLTGYPPGTWIDQDLSTLYATPEEYERVGGVVYGQLAAFGHGSDQTVMRKSDGTLLHCQMQVLPLDPNDHDQGFIFAFTDLGARKEMEDELRRTSRVLRAIQECQRAMLHARDEGRLMAEICRIICEVGGYRLAWVGLVGPAADDILAPAGQWGDEDGYLETAAVSASDADARGRGPLGEALRSRRPQVVQDVRADQSFAPWRDQALKRGYASVLGLPLIQRGRAFGVLGIYAGEPQAFSAEEVGFLEGLAQDLAFGLEALRSGEGHRLSQTLMDTSPDTILLVGEGGVIVACNQALAQRLGKSVGELVGTSILDHVPPEVGERRKEAGLRVLASGQALEFEEEMEGRIFEYRMHPVADRQGVPRYVAIYARDITERKSNERELESSIQQYRTLTQHSLQGIAILESDPTHFAYVNPRMTEIFGYSAQEFDALGPDEMWKLVHPEDRHLVRTRAESRLAGQTPPPRYEFRILRKDGETRWVEVFSALTSHGGKAASQLAYIDITERKQAEEALRKAEAKYRLLVDTTNDGIAVAQDGKPVFFNRRMEEITGYGLDEYVGQEFIEFVHPEDRTMVRERYRRRVAGEEVGTGYDFRLLDKQGQVRWLFINSSQIEWEGKPATLNTFTDLTPRKRAEEALRQSEERFRLLAENSSDLVCLHDLNLSISYISPSSARLLGYTPEELQGASIKDFLHPDDAAKVVDLIARGARGEAEPPLRNENRLKKKDGSHVWVESLASPVMDHGGALKFLLVVSRDITERKHNETTLLQMAAGVAHNFNNVLMAIMSNAQAARAGLGRPKRERGEIKGLLDNVIQGARSGRDVVQRLSRYVGGSRGGLDAQEVVDVGRLLRSLRRLVAGMGQPAPPARVEMALDLERELTVRGVGGELTEVFLNLAKNAMEAMPRGGRLDIRGRREDGQVVVTFADQGPGVDEESLSRFFEPFFSTKGVAGQGLGLTVSRAIVQAHGGRLEAASRPGQGTVLTVRLPLAPAPAAPGRSPAAGRPPAPWPLKVLLVEDEALVAMGIVTTLRKAGHQALHSSNLAQAAEDLPVFQPDIILCDLGLPDGSGWEVCSRLAREAELAGLADTPIVVLSGWSSDQIEGSERERCHATAYLQKPVESARLLQVLALAAPGRREEPEPIG